MFAPFLDHAARHASQHTAHHQPRATDAAATPAARSAVPTHILDAIADSAQTLTIERDQEIVAQGAPAKFCFQIVSGCARLVRLLEDGRRQVAGFLLPGDAVGWEIAHRHDFAVEAVSLTLLRRFPLAAIEARADQDRRFAQALRHAIAEQSCSARGHMVVLGRMTAAERIAAFLIEMADRLPHRSDAMLDLPMCRTDMADYLGLTIETVSRGLAELRRRGIVTVDRTHIVIKDRAALCRATADSLI